jgi:hypothetical protein
MLKDGRTHTPCENSTYKTDLQYLQFPEIRSNKRSQILSVTCNNKVSCISTKQPNCNCTRISYSVDILSFRRKVDANNFINCVYQSATSFNCRHKYHRHEVQLKYGLLAKNNYCLNFCVSLSLSLMEEWTFFRTLFLFCLDSSLSAIIGYRNVCL